MAPQRLGVTAQDASVCGAAHPATVRGAVLAELHHRQSCRARASWRTPAIRHSAERRRRRGNGLSPLTTYPRIDIIELWSQLNDNLIKLVDYVPEDKVNWSPKPELWNFRGILLHIAGARDGWMGEEVRDGDPAPSVYETARSKAEIQHVLQRT